MTGPYRKSTGESIDDLKREIVELEHNCHKLRESLYRKSLPVKFYSHVASIAESILFGVGWLTRKKRFVAIVKTFMIVAVVVVPTFFVIKSCSVENDLIRHNNARTKTMTMAGVKLWQEKHGVEGEPYCTWEEKIGHNRIGPEKLDRKAHCVIHHEVYSIVKVWCDAETGKCFCREKDCVR